MTIPDWAVPILEQWDVLPENDFCVFLEDSGWEMITPISWKKVYGKGNLVIKFDYCGGYNRSHTTAEYFQWVRAKQKKRRYMVRPILHYRGLLIQPRLPEVCVPLYCDCENAKMVARRLRILDWYNHGYDSGGRLKFFDTDSSGSGWWNYYSSKNRKKRNM